MFLVLILIILKIGVRRSGKGFLLKDRETIPNIWPTDLQIKFR